MAEATISQTEKQAAPEHHEFAGYDDPHKAALEDNPEHAEKLTWSVALSALFLGTSFTGPVCSSKIWNPSLNSSDPSSFTSTTDHLWLHSGDPNPGAAIGRNRW